uniref:Uncharacterized protein n=2 Tax=Avena sativa TaxID=4498 RepID=A0ACD5UDJ6_AVESA
MAGLPEESSDQSQAHGCGSYPFSFPSQPPDIRNWFSSYQYESPEVPELDADPDGSETQDPLGYRAPGHSFLKHASKAGGTALKGDRFGSKSGHDEVSATREVLPIGRSTVEQGTKRKRSLRELFGAGFLDDHGEDTHTETRVRVLSPVQRTAVDPMCNFNRIGLQNRRHNDGSAPEHSELLADSDGTIIAETQENLLGGQETNHTKWPVNCGGNFNWIGLRNRNCNHGGAATHSDLLPDSDITIIAETQENHPGSQETDHSKQPVNCAGNFNWIGLRNTKHNYEGATEHSELPADSDATILAETQENPTGCQETDQSKWPVNCAGNFNWIGLRNRMCNFEGTVEHSELLADSDSTIIAETQENPPGGQVSDRRKRLVNCGGTGLADIEEGLLEDGIEHINLPVNSSSKGLTGAEKPKRKLRDLFGADFLDDPDEANDSETRVVSAVQRNAVDPLSNCNAAGLPHIEQIHEGAAGCSELPADCDVTSSAETQENLPGGEVTEHNRLPVSRGGTSLAAETEEGFLEDVIKHSKLSADSHSTGPTDIKKAGIDHGILDASYTGIDSAVTEERSGGDEADHSKPTLNHKKAEETVAADGFIAVRRKVKPAEECRANKTPKLSRVRERATLQENRGILGTQTARDRTRSPLSDRTNLSEAPAPEICGKWKCPSKGKPYVAPPMKQLRLEQWLRRGN